MPEEKTQRSNCRFLLQQMPDGKPLIIVRLYQDTIPVLQKVVIGFDLLGGTQKEQAKKLTELLNTVAAFLRLPVSQQWFAHRHSFCGCSRENQTAKDTDQWARAGY